MPYYSWSEHARDSQKGETVAAGEATEQKNSLWVFTRAPAGYARKLKSVSGFTVREKTNWPNSIFYTKHPISRTLDTW